MTTSTILEEAPAVSENESEFYLSVPAQLFGAEKHLLHDLAVETVQEFGSDITIVNIGVLHGGSLHCLRSGAPEAKLFGIDITLLPSIVEGHEAVLIQGNSNNPLVQAMIPPPVHLLFVDGGHDEDTVGGDITGWTPKIPIGGLVAFHDYYERNIKSSFGVRIAVDRWMASEGWGEHWQQYRSCKLTIVFKHIG